MLSIARSIYAQTLSLSEANAACFMGGTSPWLRNADPKNYGEVVALRNNARKSVEHL